MKVGDCYVLGFADAARSAVEPLRRRCDTPHLYELAAVIDYRARFGENVPPPGERDLIYRHDCEAALVRYTGGVAGDLNTPRLPFRFLYYASHRQIEDDLDVHCVVATVANRAIAEPMRGWHDRHFPRKR